MYQGKSNLFHHHEVPGHKSTELGTGKVTSSVASGGDVGRLAQLLRRNMLS